jgi:hypothetical protein
MCYVVEAKTSRGHEQKSERSANVASAWFDEYAERMHGKPVVKRNGVTITEAELTKFAQVGDCCG